MLEDSGKTVRALAVSLALITTLGLTAAAIVTWRTAAAPISYRTLAYAPGQVADVAGCPTGFDADRNVPACDLIQFRHANYPDTAHISVLDPAVYGFDPDLVVVLASIYSESTKPYRSGHNDLVWTYPDDDGEPTNSSVLDSGGPFTTDEDVEPTQNVWFNGARFQSPTVSDRLEKVGGVMPLSMGLTRGTDGFATHTTDWELTQHLVADPDVIPFDTLTAVRIPFAEWTRDWAVTNPPLQERSLSLSAIWGTTLGLLALIGGVGFAVARPLLSVAKRSDRNAVAAHAAELQATERSSDLEFVLRSTHHELNREITLARFAADDLADDGADTGDLQDALTRLEEGRDMVIGFAQLGQADTSVSSRPLHADDLAVEVERLTVAPTGTGVFVGDRLLLRFLTRQVARVAQQAGAAQLDIRAGNNTVEFGMQSKVAGIETAGFDQLPEEYSEPLLLVQRVAKAHDGTFDLIHNTTGTTFELNLPGPSPEIDLTESDSAMARPDPVTSQT